MNRCICKILCHWFLAGSLLLVMFLSAAHGSDLDNKHYYVGEKTCRKCHHSPEGGNQYNIWRMSAHSKAHASLVMEESNMMARLSGISGDVFQTPVCLGCHTTASDTEAWRRDQAFFIEDGIQCEFCHGPGSAYARTEIMSDKKAAREAGLLKPDKDSCMVCHEHKGSHQAVMETDGFDYDLAIKKIQHHIPEEYQPEPISKASENDLTHTDYAGVMICAGCHGYKNSWNAVSRWRLTPHANAYAVLGTQKGIQIARDQGVRGYPQKSETCLKCHISGNKSGAIGDTSETFDVAQGVQCESCHGPGKEHVHEMSGHMLGQKHLENQIKGTRIPDEQTCKQCHQGFHGKSFDYKTALNRISHKKTIQTEAISAAPEYKTPINLAVTRDGKTLVAACEASDSIIIIDTENRQVQAEIRVMNLPNSVCFSPDEKQIFVSNRGSDTVSVIDFQTLKTLSVIPVGDEPHDLVTDKDGKRLYVANTGSHDISVVDLNAGIEIKRLSGGRGTWGMSLSADGRLISVTNNLSHFVKFRETSRSEITVIDTDHSRVIDRIMVPDANLIQGIDYSPDGEFAIVTLIRTKNLVPIVRVMQGWMITNGIGIIWEDGRVDQLLLDEVDHHFADPTDIAITSDGRYAFITGGGVNEVAVVDIHELKNILEKATPEDRVKTLPNHLGVSFQYVLKRIPVGIAPRGLVVSADGRFVYVADTLDDAVSVIDVNSLERTAVIDLGGPDEITMERSGERIFHSADVTYGRQYSCHTCHPDGGIDGLSYDISPDGLGLNPVDNRTLRGVLDTAPFKWTGKNPSLSRQCGPRLAVFFTRIDPFTPDQVRDLERYICTIPRNPNRYLTENSLTPAQQRGKVLFSRTRTSAGDIIPMKDRCDTCHAGPYFTNRKVTDVGTRSEIDTHGSFDVPHLSNIYETAPYLHDGRSDTLEEIWTRFNPEDRHGVTNDMTKDQLNDLIEYLKIL